MGNRLDDSLHIKNQIEYWDLLLQSEEVSQREVLLSWKSYSFKVEHAQEHIWKNAPNSLSEQSRAIVHKAIRELTTREQQVIGLIYWRDLSLAKIAGQLGITKSSVQTLKSRALKKLKKRLSYDFRIVEGDISRNYMLEPEPLRFEPKAILRKVNRTHKEDNLASKESA